MINQIPYGLSFVRVYRDDVVVFSDKIEENSEHMKVVLVRIESANMKLKIYQCFFVQDQEDL